jgi:peroxiredoxin/mono/diheme cytochrome c family protein
MRKELFMIHRWSRSLIAAATLVYLASSSLLAGESSSSIGKKISSFKLPDIHARQVSLDDFQDKKAIVVVFIGTECPINNAYMPRLVELDRQFGPRGVQFLAVNSNQQDTPERVVAHSRKHELTFPVLRDEDNRVADLFAARRTPEAFLLDSERIIRYQGRIDDQFGVDFKRPKPIRRDFVEALEEMLSGRTVSQPTTSVAGCLIARVSRPKKESQVTYARHVATILQKNCQECHRPGQIGPFSLLTYDDAAAWADTIREVVNDQRMPPWYADPRYGHFANDRRLDSEDRKTLIQWIDHGTPKGDDKALPPPRKFESDWTIGKPDLILSMPEEFAVPATAPGNGIEYQFFTLKTNFPEDRWVTRAESKVGAPEVVHHIVMFIVEPGREFIPKLGNAPVLCGTAPGDMPLILPPGTAKKIPAGSELIFQMHYTPNGKAQKDRSSVGLIFAKGPPERRVQTWPIHNPAFRIPPGADNYELEASFKFKENGYLLSFMPHMHLRGKDFLYEAIYPDGKKEVLLSVPRFNFGWQSVYRLAKPLPMSKGTEVHCIAHFDNSTKNPNNPDPTIAVFWGDQTWEEMMIGWIDFYYDRPAR